MHSAENTTFSNKDRLYCIMKLDKPKYIDYFGHESYRQCIFELKQHLRDKWDSPIPIPEWIWDESLNSERTRSSGIMVYLINNNPPIYAWPLLEPIEDRVIDEQDHLNCQLVFTWSQIRSAYLPCKEDGDGRFFIAMHDSSNSSF